MKGTVAPMLAFVLASCQGSAGPTVSAPSEQVVQGTSKQAEGLLARLSRYDSASGSVEERLSRETVLEALFTYSPHQPISSGMFDVLEEERGLEALGKSAVPSIVKATTGFKDLRLVMRLLLLLGRIGDPAGIPVGLHYAKTSPSDQVRRAAMRSIGLIADRRSVTDVLALMAQDATLFDVGLWVLARCDVKGASAKYCDWVSNELRSGLLDKFPETGILRPPPDTSEPSGVQGPKITAFPPREPMEFVGDLINLSDLREPRVVAILIEGLRHSDPLIQHLSIELLSRRANFKPKENVELTCDLLHNGTQYRAWSKWWSSYGDKVQFSDKSRKFTLN